MSLRILFIAAAFTAHCSGTAMPKPRSTSFVPVNGIQMYYETYGEQRDIPLLLLHGGASTIESTFGRVIPILAKNHFLIAVEEQAHGRTGDRAQPLRFATSAQDVASLLEHLKIQKADVWGFSNGASIAMHLAIQHPGKVRKLVFASSLTKRSGAPPQLWDFIAKSDFSRMPQALKDAFLKVNPDQAKLKNLHAKTRERMMNFTDIPDEALKSINAETLILTADRDVAALEHTIELSRQIPKARLMVLPYGHGDYIGEASSTVNDSKVHWFTVGILEDFLNKPF
jgi:pimeloyl-ACP methyl ester carboxylesterase